MNEGQHLQSNGAPLAGNLEIPIIELARCQLQIGRAPADATKRALFVGPIFLQISLDEDAAKIVVQGLTGVEIARPGDSIV